VERLIGLSRGSLAWRHGVVTGNSVAHRIDERGDHHVEVVVPARLAEYEPPKLHQGGSLGESTPPLRKEPDQ
jgi:hypothetical protein